MSVSVNIENLTKEYRIYRNNKDRIKDFDGISIDGLAIVSAIIAQKNIADAARELKNIFLSK